MEGEYNGISYKGSMTEDGLAYNIVLSINGKDVMSETSTVDYADAVRSAMYILGRDMAHVIRSRQEGKGDYDE